MNLKEIMSFQNFAVLGDTLNPEKYAAQIKEGLFQQGYTVYSVGKELGSLNDIAGEVDIIDLCIHPVKGLALLKENKKPFRMIVVQPGAGDEALFSYMKENGLPYVEGCLLVGLRLYPRNGQ